MADRGEIPLQPVEQPALGAALEDLGDEPAAGLTPEEREHTTDILVEAAKTRAVVVVEHDMEFVRRLNCRVTVLHEGAVLAEGSLDHVTKNQDVIDVYLGR